MSYKIDKVKDNVWNGCAIGVLSPILPGSLAWLLMQNVSALKEAHWLLICSVGINAILMNYFFKKDKENIGRGILSVTFLWAFAFAAYKGFG